MTLEEINNLQLVDYQTEMTTRVLAKYSDQLDSNPELLDDLIVNEFEVYKNELRADEDARLEAEREAERLVQSAKRESINERMENFGDMSEAFHSLHDVPNMKLWLMENIHGNPDVYDADTKLLALEAKRDQLASSPEKVKADWEGALRQDLADNNITTDGLLEALVKKILLNDSTLADELVTKLQEINTRNPRP